MIKACRRAICLLLLPGVLQLSVSELAQAKEASGPSPVTATANIPAHPLTREDLAAWLDGLIPYAIREGDVAGGVISVVADGKILFEKGYGYADVARRRTMDPVRTIIRPGSISKLFVWTAVMQLVERGQLDLDADVNRYLDFHIPDHDGRPITLRDIVTHRTGFSEQVKGILGRSPPIGLERFMKVHLPDRVYRAGEVPSYSNYASALAGYIVQRVSKQRFEDYAARHILQPLGMRRSTFVQPLPRAWQPDLAIGYRNASEPAQYFEYTGPFPAGGLDTTADDMARFMIAHLGLGAFNGHRILAADTTRAMHAPQRKTFPALNTMAIGFYETTRNGHRSIAHNGGTQFFHSDLHLLVNDNVGIFISLNSAGTDDAATKIHNAFFNGFMDRYFPRTIAPHSTGAPPATARAHGALLEGYWDSSRRSVGNWLSLADLFSPILISADEDGRVSLPFSARGIVRWTEIAPFVWQSEDGDKMQALTRNGRPTMLGLDAAPPAAFLPVPWWRSPGWLAPAICSALAVLTLYGLSLPVGYLVRRRYDIVRAAGRGRFWHYVPRLLSLGLVGAAITWPVLLIKFSGDLDYMSSRTDIVVLILQATTLTLLVAVSGLHMMAGVQGWRSRQNRYLIAVSSLVLLATGVLWWAAIAFSLITFNMNY
jgi:CubicO group peptidase (beta-lactamase class C family)